MSAQQPPRPAPPEGCATWLDCFLARIGENAYARAELAELRKALETSESQGKSVEGYLRAAEAENAALRKELKQATDAAAKASMRSMAYGSALDTIEKELADTKALLKRQAENTLEAMAQRDAARAHAELRKQAHHTEEKLHFAALAELSEAQVERDSLRAQVQDLREAALALGELEEGFFEYSDAIRLPWNAHVAKLRAEPAPKALPGAGEPAAGEGAGR